MSSTPTDPQPIVVLYDAMCSVCTNTAAKLRKLDNNRNRLLMVDLRQETTLLEKHNLSPADVRRVMHAITPDGQVLTAMNALRTIMSAVGRGWMINWTKLPIIRPITDRLYIAFANNRLRWFSKPISKPTCPDGACSTNPDSD